MDHVSRREAMTQSLASGALAAGLTATTQAQADELEHQKLQSKKRDWWDKEFRKLVTLGESTTAGGWASYRERCWAHQLTRTINEFQRIPVQLVNVGIGANVISTKSPCYEHSGKPAALERIEPHVWSHEPDLLIVSYGLNDARGGTSESLFAQEMHKLIDQVRAKIQPLIVLLGPYFMTGFNQFGPHWNHSSLDGFHQFNRTTAAIADEKDCLFVDLLATYDNAFWLVHHDSVHANDLGHRMVANQIFSVLASNCSGLARETQELEQHIPPWRDESVLRDIGNKE